jgi:multiple sugar transport system permease protein
MTRRLSLLDKTIIYSVLTAMGSALILPFIFMISISLAGPATTTKLSFSVLPEEHEFSNYIKIMTEDNVGRWILNSIFLVTFCMIGQVFVSSFVAYGFARLRAPGKNILFLLLLSTMMIPGEVTMIPQFVIFRKLGWINTYLPLIVPNFFGGAFNIFLMRQFISRIPTSLDDAAKIDGLSYFGIYWRIILPLIRPILITVAIFTFQWNWGWFMGPLIYINDIDKAPLALGVQILSATRGLGEAPKWNLVMAASMLLTLPMILVFFVGQRYVFEANISAGSAEIK